MSAHQLMRMLDIRQYKSAWFMAHRIRYAMTGELPEKLNGIVEADENCREETRRRGTVGDRAQGHEDQRTGGEKSGRAQSGPHPRSP